MIERLRYVTFDIGGRAVTQLDLNDGSQFSIVRGSFAFTPPAKTQTTSTADRQYGGSRQTGETTDNGAISWKAMVIGATAENAQALVESLLATVQQNPLLQFVEWLPDGAPYPSFYDVRGTAQWNGEYEWVSFAGVKTMQVQLSIPVAPGARGHQLDILDVFGVDTRSDYTYDTGAEANEEVAGGALKCAANANQEQAAIHTARGYQYVDNQQTSKGIPKATITGWKNAVRPKRTAPTTFLEVYVDDEGTNSRLRIDKVIAGERKNLATTNLAARVANGVSHWVRGRIEGNVITAEYFLAAPGPMTAPTLTNAYTLAAGTERETFGAGVEGAPGRAWIPKTVGAEIDEYSVEPFTHRNQTLPAKLALGGTVPGDMPALADVTITPSGGAAPPIWAKIAWAAKPASGLAQAPFGIIEAESGGNLSGWASTANANSRGGTMLKDAAALSSDVYQASYEVDPSLMVADAFTQEVAIEVFARVMMDSTIVTPSLTLSVRPADGLNYGAARYTDEWGSAGKLLTPPATGTEKFRRVRLGTIRMLVDPLRPRKWLLWLEGEVGAGTSGAWGVDYLEPCPATARCCGPTSKANDSSYPKFIASTAETSKTIRRDLTAVVSKPPAFGHPDHGLGGQLLELPPGEAELLVALSSLVPDDPTEDATTEQLAYSATVHASVVPRWQFFRSGS